MPYRTIKRKREKEKNNSEEQEQIESNSVLFQKDTLMNDGEKKVIRVRKEGKIVAKYEEMQEKPETQKLKTIIIEQDHGVNFSVTDLENDRTMMIPLNIKEKIEKIILKILYDEKSVKSLKILTEKVLERASKEKITISEKPINQIIYQLNKEEKIFFTQTEGWKIRI